MRAGARSAVTLGVLAVILLVGAVWGWSAMTAPFPGKADAPVCEDRQVDKGAKVFPDQVVVSVYNAGSREGLAGRTMALLEKRGFKRGDGGNAPDDRKVPGVQIWSEQPRNPAVRLVASALTPRPHVVKHESLGAGVTVVVGDGFRKVVAPAKSVVARNGAVICSPPLG